MKCKCGAFIGSGRLSDTCGKCKTDNDLRVKDKRINDLESAMQEFIDHSGRTGDIAYAYHAVQKFKQLLEK